MPRRHLVALIRAAGYAGAFGMTLAEARGRVRCSLQGDGAPPATGFLASALSVCARAGLVTSRLGHAARERIHGHFPTIGFRRRCTAVRGRVHAAEPRFRDDEWRVAVTVAGG